MSQPRWLDSTLFNGEEIMKLRLEYLSPYVDIFYIVEQRYTHQGQRKETLFVDSCKDWFKSYKVCILVDESEPSTDPWVKENRHRNYVIPWLMAEQGPWICTVCDCDEIPDTTAVEKEKQNIYQACNTSPVYLYQEMFYYNFQWRMGQWKHPFIINDSQLQKTTLQKLRNGHKDGPLLRCGWHFSYFMSAEEIQRKIQSFAHKEFNTSDITSLKNIRHAISNGIDVFHRSDKSFTKVPLDNFPELFKKFHTNLIKLQDA